jgi:hypothetical protein
MRRVRSSARFQNCVFAFCATSLVRPSSAFVSPLSRSRLVSSRNLAFLSTRWASSSSSSTTSATGPMTTTTTAHEKVPWFIGGDFAGLQAKFRPFDGSLIPLPEYLIPDALREWGQEPTILEVLVSEEKGEGEQDNMLLDLLLKRQTITVFPAIGCGIDNLETQKAQESFPKETSHWSQYEESAAAVALDTTLSSSEEGSCLHKTETLFALPDSHRIRIGLTLKVQKENDGVLSHEIQSPIVIHLERQTNTTSSHGTIADGGGLDGRTMSTLLGKWLKTMTSFAERKNIQGGQWKASSEDVRPSSTTGSVVAMTVIHLAGNVTIATAGLPVTENNQQGFLLEVSHFSGGSKRTMERRFLGLECPKRANYRQETGTYITL